MATNPNSYFVMTSAHNTLRARGTESGIPWRSIYHHPKNAGFRAQTLTAMVGKTDLTKAGIKVGKVWVPGEDAPVVPSPSGVKTAVAIAAAKGVSPWTKLLDDPRNGELRYKAVDPAADLPASAESPIRVWIPDAPSPVGQPKKHICDGEENLRQIASRYGFRSNKAFYAANPSLSRTDKSRLEKGTGIEVPSFAAGGVSITPGREHRFVVKALKQQLHLVLFDPQEGKKIPLANKKFQILIERPKQGARGTEWVPYPNAEREFQTGSDGSLQKGIPMVSRVKLRIWKAGDSARPVEYIVQVGDLEPVSTMGGLRTRLKNLGYTVGSDKRRTVTLDAKTKNGLKAFCVALGLDKDLDWTPSKDIQLPLPPDVAAALVSVYGR